MEKNKGQKQTRTSITFDSRFLRILETLAAANGMSRDEFVEYAVRKSFGNEIKVIEATLLKEEEGRLPSATQLAVRVPA